MVERVEKVKGSTAWALGGVVGLWLLLVPPSRLLGGAGWAAQAVKGDLQRGRELFINGPCMNCHPNGGEGAGPKLYGPDFERRFPTDDLIFRQVRNGKGEMPPIPPDMVGDEELAHIIAYIRSLGK